MAYFLNPIVLLGLLQGLILALTAEFWKGWGAYQPLLLALNYGLLFILLGGQLIGAKKENNGQLAVLLLFGLIFALITHWVSVEHYRMGHRAPELAVGWWFMSFFVAYIAMPFIQSWPAQLSRGFEYRSLFTHSWDNVFLVLIAGVFAGVYWLLIVLWVALFNILGVSIFEDIFYHRWFAVPTLGIAFGVGLTVAREHHGIVSALQNVVITMAFLLMPLTAVISILFIVSLPFTGLQPIWDTGYSTPIIVSLIAANVFFINGIYQDGEQRNRYPDWLRWVVSIALASLVMYAVIAAYSVYLRIAQHGLTPSRIHLVILVLVASLHAVAYLIVAFRRNPWLGSMGSYNVVNAWIVVALLLVVNLPGFNPLSISAWQQYQRFSSGKVDVEKFDFGVLRYSLGRYGEEYLAKIRAVEDHPQQALLDERLAVLDETENLWQWKSATRNELQPAARLRWHGEDLGGVDEIAEHLKVRSLAGACQFKECLLFGVDLDRDGEQEALLVSENYWLPILFKRDQQQRWQRVGSLTAELRKPGKELIRMLEAGDFRVEEPRYGTLVIGDIRFNVDERGVTPQHLIREVR